MPGHTTGQAALTRHVARRSARLTKRYRAAGQTTAHTTGRVT